MKLKKIARSKGKKEREKKERKEREKKEKRVDKLGFEKLIYGKGGRKKKGQKEKKIMGVSIRFKSASIALMLSTISCLTPLSLPLQPLAAQTEVELLETANNLEKTGIEKFQQGDIKGCIKNWEQALLIYCQLQDKAQEARLLENFKVVYIELGEAQKATEYFETSLTIARELNNQEAMVSLLLRLGEVYREVGEDIKATPFYEEALTVSQTINDWESAGIAIGSLGKIYESQGDTEKAIALYQQAWEIAQKTKDANLAMSALNSLGNIYYQQQNYSAAIQYYTQLYQIAGEVGAKERESEALKSLGNAYYFLGNCEYALAFFQASLQLATEKTAQLGILQNQGNAAYCLGEFELALQSYQEGLTLAQGLNCISSIAYLKGNIGLTYISLERYTEAVEYLQQDLSITKKLGDSLIEGQALGSLGDAYYYQQDFNQALDYYQQSFAIAQQEKYLRGEGLMLTNIGASLYYLKRLPEAEKALKQAIVVLASLRGKVGDVDENQVSIFERERRTYGILQQVLIELGKVEEALEVAEAGRSRALADLLARKLSATLELKPPTIEHIKQTAKDKQATLVEYSIIYDAKEQQEIKLYIWVIQPQGKVEFKEVDLTDKNIGFREAVNNTREAMGVEGRGSLTVTFAPEETQDRSLSDLYQLLVTPIAEYLPDNPESRVVFIPQEELFLVAFPSLKDTDGEYLIDKHTLVTAPSIQVLALTQQESKGAGEVLVVGNPVMPEIQTSPDQPPEQLNQLPGTETEAQNIAQLLSTQPLIGVAATETAVVEKMPAAKIIHFATHGLLDVSSDGVLQSEYAGFKGDGGAIAFTPSEQDNGLLTVEEIINLDLNADLVVLSACDTGRGKITGDGVLGLSRAFVIAGAANLIVSLWSVPDAPTATLMVEFYRQLEVNPDKAQALRQGMLKTKEQHPNPRDWAAFTLMGL